MITLDLSILNQKGTPMFYSDIFANRPNFGIVGRIFISTDTYAIYRDTGSAWDQIGGSGSGITGSGTAGTLPIWTSSSALGDSAISEAATLITATKDFQINGYVAATPTLTAANNASSLASYGINTLSYAAGFSSNNIGALYGGMAGFNLQTFAGSATFAQANVASGSASVNSIDFSSAGSTITMTQSSGIRVMSAQQNLFQYQGTNSGIITHAAISQNTGFYRPSGASGTLTITNAYSHLINALDDYGAGFNFTNRWGIYQAGSSDINYFAAHMLLGSVVDNGNRLQITGNQYLSGNLTIGSTSGIYRIDIISAGGLFETIRINNAFTGASDGSQLLLGNSANFTNAFFRLNGGGNSSQAGVGSLNIGLVESAPIGFFTGNTQRLTLNSSGNLQLGTTSGGNWRFLCYQNSSTGLGTSASFMTRQDGTDDIAQFYAGGSALVTIKSTGNLLINTINNPGQKLYLNGSLRIDGQSSSTAGGNSGQHLIINCDGTTYKIALLNP